MKPFYNVAGVVSLVFIGVGLFWLWKLGWFGTGMGNCMLAFLSGVALAFGCYAFHLRSRINALEKRLEERVP